MDEIKVEIKVEIKKDYLKGLKQRKYAISTMLV